MIRPSNRRTIQLSELQRLAFCNSKHLPQRVVHNGAVKEWVGIGWITVEDKPKPTDVYVVEEPDMSRTRKGSKGPNCEYWTARPGNKQGSRPGKFTKKQTHRAERRLAKPGQTGHLIRRFGRQEEE